MLNALLDRLSRPLVIALAVFLLAFVLAANLVWRLEEGDLLVYRESVTRDAIDRANALQRGVERSLSAAQVLAVLVQDGKGRVPNFEAIAGRLLLLYPGVSSLQLAPQGVVQTVVPLRGNEKAIGHDLLKDRTRNAAAFLARDTRELTLDGPFDLIQGGQGAVGRHPLFLDDDKGNQSFWGFTSVVIGFPKAIEAARFKHLTDQRLAWEIWRVESSTRKKVSIAASSPEALVDAVETDLQVANATWTLSVAPLDGWRNPLRFSIRLALGLLFSLLFAYLTKLLLESKVQEKGLEALVSRRTAEVLAREADLNHAQTMARIGSWVLNLATKELRGSAEAFRILGVTGPQSINYKAFLRQVHPLDREAVDRASRAAFKGEPYDIEYRILAGATTRWVHSHAELEFDQDGRLSTARGTIQDITDRKRAEEASRAAEEQFRGLVEQSITGIYILQDGKLVYVNPRLAEILGYDSAEELTGYPAILVVAEEHRAAVEEKMRQRLAGELGRTSYEFTALRKDGTTVEIGVHAAPATHQGRRAIIGLMQDISEKKRAEEQIQDYVAQLKTAFMSTVEVATTMSELRDPYTAGHERRVGEIAVAIGAELGLEARRLEGLRVAGYLHDIGKITIPAEILSKPGKLSAIEFQLIKGHPQSGYDVLKDVQFPWPVAGVALQHHERIDGSGYPQGLKGEEILLDARIMAVADVVEAMSSHRPYRPGLGIDKALAEIERGRGSAYDIEVADVCLRLFREKGYRLPV